jgi:hypothetical protein
METNQNDEARMSNDEGMSEKTFARVNLAPQRSLLHVCTGDGFGSGFFFAR